MRYVGEFLYVDFATRALYRFRNNIVHVGDLGNLANRYGQTDCFCTYFLFDKGISDYVRDNHDSVAGYQGPCYANFIPLDIDAPDLGQSLQTTREISHYLIDNWTVPEEALTIYFSGMKGFHLNIPKGAFGKVEPGTELPRIFREVRRSIVNEAGIKHPEAVDFSISDRLRLLRLPNTKHTKSGLYKVPLDIKELFSREHEEITNIAQNPREPWLTDESGLVPRNRAEPVSNAVEMYKLCTEKAEKELHNDLPDPKTFLTRGDIERMFCHAELELYRDGVPEGARSSMCLRLASRMRSAGYDQNEASAMIEEFANRCSPPLETGTARNVVKSVYRSGGNGYQFGCGSGEGDPSHTKLVYDRCPYHGKRLECEKFRQFRSLI